MRKKTATTAPKAETALATLDEAKQTAALELHGEQIQELRDALVVMNKQLTLLGSVIEELRDVSRRNMEANEESLLVNSRRLEVEKRRGAVLDSDGEVVLEVGEVGGIFGGR